MTVPRNFYDDVGGAPVFHRIVGALLRGGRRPTRCCGPLYPEEDLGPAEERLRMFLEQYWGGPRTYSDQRGHPRLRMRHVPFRIGPLERDAWLRCMRIAVDEAGLAPRHRDQLWAVPGVRRGQHGQLAGLADPQDVRGPRSTGCPRAVVEGRRLLPGLRAQLHRLDGDGVGDLQGDPQPPGLPGAARRRRAVAQPRSTPPRWSTTATTSPTTAASTRCGATSTPFDELIADAHAHGIRVTVDLVPNHTSDQHPWFRAALASPPGSPERARYHFRAGPGHRRQPSRPTTGAACSAARPGPG